MVVIVGIWITYVAPNPKLLPKISSVESLVK
jgi:hypothetical protein